MSSYLDDRSGPCKRDASHLEFARCVSVVALCLSVAVLGHAADEAECSLSSVEEGIQKGIIIKKSDDQVANHAMYLERKTLLHVFHLFPEFYFMTGKGSTNACAFPPRDPEVDPDRGIVTFGEELLRREVREAGGPEYASSVPAIMGHEFAHLLQIKNGSTFTGPMKELQADYIAGWYIGRREKVVPTTVSSERSLQTIMRSFYTKGDYQLNDASHHGTPDERVAAVTAGYRSSQLQIADMYRESLKFVSQRQANAQIDDSERTYDPLELSAALSEVMKHQSNKFADLRGVLDEDSKATWIAKLKLPGAVRCVVQWRNEYQGDYDCDMTVSLDQGMAEENWKKLVEEIQKRYAKGWKRTDSGSSNSSLKEVIFTSPNSDDISLKVSIAKSTLHRGYDVEIEIPFDDY